MAFQNFDFFSRRGITGRAPVTTTAASSLLCAEYCEAGPGWVPAFRSEMHCLIVSLSSAPVFLSTVINGTAIPLRLERGSIAVTKANTTASWRWDQPLRLLLVWIEPTTLRDFIEGEMRTIALDAGLFDQTMLHDPELYTIAAQLADAVRARKAGADVILDALAAVFLVVLVRNHALSLSEEVPAPGTPLGAIRFRKLVSFVMANLAERLTLARMAEELAMSPSALSRAMRESVGAGASEFVQRLRLRTARQMIRETDLPLKEVAATCGFADQAHLSRCFKKRYGVPPRLFRRGVGRPDAACAPDRAVSSG